MLKAVIFRVCDISWASFSVVICGKRILVNGYLDIYFLICLVFSWIGIMFLSLLKRRCVMCLFTLGVAVGSFCWLSWVSAVLVRAVVVCNAFWFSLSLSSSVKLFLKCTWFWNLYVCLNCDHRRSKYVRFSVEGM